LWSTHPADMLSGDIEYMLIDLFAIFYLYEKT
jgi:hypothetical protein